MTRTELLKELDRVITSWIVNEYPDICVLKAAREQLNNPVYVVTEGIYSDYHIEGAFTDEESAKKYATLCGGTVETLIPLDRQDGHRDDEKVLITYNYSTNKIINIYFWIRNEQYDKDYCSDSCFKFSLKVNSRVGQDILLKGADSELALKVAQDRYAAWKYENKLVYVNGIASTQKNLDSLAEGGAE